MKLLKTIVPLLIILVLSACSTDDANFENESLKDYLNKNNNKYIFYDDNSIETIKGKIPEPIHFNTYEEAEEFLNSVGKVKIDPDGLNQKSNDVLTHAPIDDGGGSSESIYRDTFYLGGGFFMNISFYVEGCQGSALNSYLSGFTLGVSYDHLGGTLNTSADNDGIDYHIEGLIHYYVFVNDIGEVFSQSVSSGGSYNCNH